MRLRLVTISLVVTEMAWHFQLKVISYEGGS